MTSHRPLLLLLCSAIVHLASAADDWPTAVVRVLGLCYPERANDLKAELAERSELRVVSVDYDRAEVTIAYDAKRTKPDDFKHLGGHRGFEIRSRGDLPFDQLAHVDIAVVGLDCKGCALGTYNAIGRIDGVYVATVDYKTGVVSTRIDPAKTNRAALEEALKKANVTLKNPDAGAK